ncbi:MAG: His-Xaa-Ser system radical SAM maturase HxsC [Bacteroidetes bacterium]|nr:MAG: His-Xaa-Ser system radical SAM maturase HxsC [Bacteroidota bacterium]
MNLRTKGTPHNISEQIVAKVISENDISRRICLSGETDENLILSSQDIQVFTSSELLNNKIVFNIPSLSDLASADILLISPDGSVNTLFRQKSTHNSLFITDRCNSNCLMCSQPPKNRDDLDFFFGINTRLITMIPSTTKELGITGGEPTLLGDRLITLLEMITDNLPNTEIHVLTNGRAFAWQNIPESLKKINYNKIVFGIPLYSDFYKDHDYIVQARQAFNQTVLGFHNMARYGFRLELRVVLHELTYRRLPSLARYIFKNLPFIEHIAFMGLEYTGYTPHNSNRLWIDPSNYGNQLEEAVLYLDQMGMNVSIYNLQHCLLKPSLWKYARNSISDWKKEYLEECNKCKQLKDCGGVFATSKKHSNEIKAIL